MPPAMRPACFLFEGGAETYADAAGATAKRSLQVRLFIYVDAHDPATDRRRAAQCDHGIRSRRGAGAERRGRRPSAARRSAGAVHRASIDGKPLKDPGDLDGDGLLVVPITLVLP